MAQEVTWVDATTFAVGRWDGTLSLFKFNDLPTAGPLVTAAASTPAMEGVQMIVWLGPRAFATSNDEGSIIAWSTADGTWRDLRARVCAGDPSLGVANSGDTIEVEGVRYLVVGHANGFLSTWKWVPASGTLELRKTIDLRSNRPTNPWGIHNIRGVCSLRSALNDSCVVTGAEDGSLCVVDAIGAELRSRTVYNPKAERGINSVALFETKLLVANCAVGADDNNLWSYSVDTKSYVVRPCDGTRLVVNPSAPQVFNFCTVWGRYAGGPCFFASTEEGTLWMGTTDDEGKLKPLGYRRVTSPLGAALAYNHSGRLVLVAYDLHEFRTGADQPLVVDSNPESLDDDGRG